MWKRNSPPARSFRSLRCTGSNSGVRRRVSGVAVQQRFLLHLRARRRSVVQRPAVQRIVGRYAWLKLTAGQSEALHEITDRIAAEYAVADNLREEMLRILLKRFIITCTRMARERFAAGAGSERQFDIVRRYYVLVDRYTVKRSRCRSMPFCCTAPRKRCRIFSPFTACRRRCRSSATGRRPKPGVCCSILRKAPRRSPVSLDSKTRPLSAGSSKGRPGKAFRNTGAGNRE